MLKNTGNTRQLEPLMILYPRLHSFGETFTMTFNWSHILKITYYTFAYTGKERIKAFTCHSVANILPLLIPFFYVTVRRVPTPEANQRHTGEIVIQSMKNCAFTLFQLQAGPGREYIKRFGV